MEKDPQTLSARLQKGDLLAANCPSRDVLKHVTSRWGVLILMSLEQDTLRFSALRRRIGGVSERMLAQTLKWLEGDGLVERIEYDVVPPHVEYRLTPLGLEAAAKQMGAGKGGGLPGLGGGGLPSGLSGFGKKK